MRVLLANKFYFPKGGPETVLLDEQDGLTARGHTIIPFAAANPGNLASEWANYFAPEMSLDHDGQSLLSRGRVFGRFLWNGKAAKAIKHLIHEARPDVAHAHNIYHQLSPSILWELRRQGVPVVLTLHDYKLVCPSYLLLRDGTPCERCSRNRFYNAAFGRCVRGSIAASAICSIELTLHRMARLYENSVDVFVSPSQFLVDTVRRMGFTRGRFEVIPNPTGMVSETFSKVAPRAPLLFLGPLRCEKGVDVLLEAIRLSGRRLRVVGDGPERVRLQSLADQLGIGSLVEFLGFCERAKVLALLRESCAVVVPSRGYENFPTVALESLAIGRPVIGSRIGGITEIVDDGINGLLVEPGNSSELASAITRLTNAPALLSAMGEAARRKAAAQYSLPVHLDRLDWLFRDLVERGGRRKR